MGKGEKRESREDGEEGEVRPSRVLHVSSQ